MSKLYDEAEKAAEKKIRTENLRVTNYVGNTKTFHEYNPFFYDRTKIFWLWNKKQNCYEMVDETDLMILLEKEMCLAGATITTKTKNNYLEAFRRIGRELIPEPAPNTWIQFKNKIVDIKTGEEFDVSPKYFFTNPIPWNLGESEETPEIDHLLEEWVGDHKQTLYEIIAYSCLRNYPIHVLFALIGCGRNGKSRFLAILEKFVGLKNVTSTEFDDLLDNRFEKAKLYKKLICTMGETNFTTVSKSSILKKLTGQDLIGFEFKNKDPFDDYNYAKIIISSNSLPTSIDTSDGWYRRWIIIDFDKVFPEGKDVIQRIPDVEFDNLCKKSVRILRELIDKGSFFRQGSIEERKNNYIKASNPISLFIEQHCIIGDSFFVKNKDMFIAYNKYLQAMKRRPIKKKEFSSVLSEEGFFVELKDHLINGSYLKTYWIDGLKLSEKSEKSEFHKKPTPPYLPLKSDISDKSDVLLYPRSEISMSADYKTIRNVRKLRNPDPEENFDDLQGILLDRVDHQAPLDDLIRIGFSEELIKQWIFEGLVFEPKPGFIRLL